MKLKLFNISFLFHIKIKKHLAQKFFKLSIIFNDGGSKIHIILV